MVKKWKVPKVELSSFKHDNFDDHIIIGSDKETENSSTVSRTNPLYTDLPGGLGDLEEGSFSSGYFSTFRRDGKIDFKSDDDTAEEDGNKQSFETVHDFHPHLPNIELVTSRDIITKKVSKSTSSDQNCNWYLLRKFGMEEEESRFSTYRPSIHRKNIFSDAQFEGSSNKRKRKFSRGTLCKFLCISLLIIFFIFIIIVVSLVLSQGRTIFGSI